MNKTLGLIKPCAVRKGLEAEIFKTIEESGLKCIKTKRLIMNDALASEFYSEHRDRPFFDGLKEFMTSGEIVAFILEGDDVVNRYREIMGATNPENAIKGTLRNLFGESLDNNAVHGSDSVTSAAREISIIFS